MIKFIKRFCFKISRRLLRFFIFFTILSLFFSFSVSSLAYGKFKNLWFSSFVADGRVLTYTTVGHSEFVLSEIFDKNDRLDEPLLIPAADGYFDSFSVKIANSSNGGQTSFNKPFNAGDVLYLRNSVTIVCDDDSLIYYSYSNSTLNDIQFTITTSQGSTVLMGNDIVKSIYFSQNKDYCVINFEIQYQFNTAATLESLSFDFYNALDDYDVSVSFCGYGVPINGTTLARDIVFFLGPESVLRPNLDTDYLSGIFGTIGESTSILNDNLPTIDSSINQNTQVLQDNLPAILSAVGSGTSVLNQYLPNIDSSIDSNTQVLQDNLPGILSGVGNIADILGDNFTNDFPNPDTSLNDLLEENEQEILDAFDYNSSYGGFFDGSNGFKGFFQNNISIRRCFTCIADMFSYSLTFPPLRFLIYISISLGLLSMALNFTAVLVSNMRQDKRGDFNKHGNGHYDRER